MTAVTSRFKNQDPNTKFAAVGYCFGAPYVCDELAKDVVSVGAFAHPAFLKEHHFRNIESKFQERKVVRSRRDANAHQLRTIVSFMCRD